MLVLAAVLACSDAHALQRVQSGPTLELGVGPALGGAPARFAVGGQLSAGWWVGPYDDDYALGRFWAVAVTGRADFEVVSGDLRIAPMLEIRRGMDLFVVAPHFFLAGGPVIGLGDPQAVGATGRIGGGVKLRRTPKLGFTARLGGGVDYLGGKVSPAVGLTIGAGWSSPVR
ncbi:MAG: hypothetical protein H6737_10620 [Alphaproteobacteria bacterium]|nr:hypothetical protein [Alphaproteobacteria bacterium]